MTVPRRGSTWYAGETSSGLTTSITGEEYSLVGFHSDTGKKPTPGGGVKRINQDTAMVSLMGLCNDLVLAVYDGHGDAGRRISRAAAREVFKALVAQVDTKQYSPAAALASALPAADDALPEREAIMSGTTAIIAIVRPSQLIVACVGDSRCVLGKAGRSGFMGLSKDGPWEAIDLSKDQKPDDPVEKARILEYGGEVVGSGAFDDPARVWKRIDGVGKIGTAVARSLGDHALSEYGVISEPEVVEHAVSDDDMCVVLGSDGVWDMVSSAKAVALAQQNYPDADLAARAIMGLAAKGWRKAEKQYRDDISVVVAYLASPDGTKVNTAVVNTVARFGNVGLGANLEDHEDGEQDGMAEEDDGLGNEEDDYESADDEDDDDDDDDEPDGPAAGGAAAAQPGRINRRLTIATEAMELDDDGELVMPAKKGSEGELPSSPSGVEMDEEPANHAVSSQPQKSGGGGCCVIS